MSISKWQMVEVLGSSTLLLPSSFVYCHIYNALYYSSHKNRCGDLFHGPCCACAFIFCYIWKLPACTGLFLVSAVYFGAENVEHMQEKNNGNTFLPAVLAADLTLVRKDMSRSDMALYFLKR